MPLEINFDQGLNTAADPSELRRGELTDATGAYYRPGDKRAWKIGGNTQFAATGTSKRVDGVALLQFDDAGETDKLVALSDGTLFGSDISSPGSSGYTGSYSSLQSGLGNGATSLSAAHFNDRWYLGLVTANKVLESDGTVRDMGMSAPLALSLNTTGTGSTTTRASSSSGVAYTNAAQAYDSDVSTYASLRTNTPGTSITTFRWSGTSDTGTSRYLRIKWAIGASTFTDEITYEYAFDDVGGTSTAGFLVDVKIEVSENNGGAWTTILDSKDNNRTKATSILSHPVTDSLEVDGNLLVRVTKAYRTGSSYADLRLYDLVVESGSEAANFTPTTGFWYALTEYDEGRGLESPAAVIDSIVTFTTKNHVTFDLPSAATNDTATHWRIYRTTDGGNKQSSLGLIGQIDISQTSWIDDFRQDKDTLAYPQYPWLRVLAQQDSDAANPLFFDQNNPPPRFARIRAFDGSLVGLSEDGPRALFYSMAAFPEAWPKINVIESFPFEEWDQLVDCVPLGSVLLIAAKGTMMRLTSLPRVSNGLRDTSRVEQLKGAPGCVGRYALTAYSVSGEPRAAWISPYGVYVTNGDRSERISDNIDWTKFDGVDKSKWVLHWDANRLCLILSTGESDGRYYLLHMAPEHQRTNGRGPKWTGPHYGGFVGFTSGQVGSKHILYGAHRSDGSVYVMDRGGTDESESYQNGTSVPFILKTGEIYASDGDYDWAALDAVLHHTNFGGGETCTLDWTVENDHETGSGHTRSQTVSLAGGKGTQLDIAQRCQWATATITHTGTGTGSVRDLRVRTARRGSRGDKRIA